MGLYLPSGQVVLAAQSLNLSDHEGMDTRRMLPRPPLKSLPFCHYGSPPGGMWGTVMM